MQKQIKEMTEAEMDAAMEKMHDGKGDDDDE